MLPEEWYKPIIFKFLYGRPSPPRFVLENEPSVLGSEGKTFDLRLEDNSRELIADFEIKGWWPGVPLRPWLEQIKRMLPYLRSEKQQAYLLLLVRSPYTYPERLPSLVHKQLLEPLNDLLSADGVEANLRITHIGCFPHDLGSGEPNGLGEFGVTFLRFGKAEPET